MNQKKDKVTVITVCYNCEHEIEKTIESVVNQSYSNIEYLIQDGLSTDDTLDIIERYKDNISKINSEKDSGVFDAMNKAIQYATGDWIVFMNAGDKFHDEETLSKVFNHNTFDLNVGVVFGDVYFVRKKGLQCIKSNPFYNQDGIRDMGICHQSLFVRTNLAKQVKFDLSYKYAADYNMVMNIYKLGFKFEYIPIGIADYDLTGISTNNKISQYKEVAKICDITSGKEYYVKLMSIYIRVGKSIIKRILNSLFA